jgi:hypothetical protein
VHGSMLAGVRLEEKSSAACAVTSWQDQVYVAWTGSDLHLNLASSPDGRVLAGKRRLAYRTYQQRWSGSGSDSSRQLVILSPSLAGSGEQLFLAWTKGNGAPQVLVAERPDAQPVTIRQRSTEPPSVTMSERGELLLAWTGTSGQVNLATVAHDWSTRPIGLTKVRSNVGPALCSHRGDLILAWSDLILAWIGTDRRINVLTVRGNRPTQPVRLEQAKSDHPPAVCSHRGDLVLAWTGSDRRINVLTVRGNRPTQPVRLEQAKSDHPPAVCSHRGDLVLAWTGGDRRLNVARLQ